MSFIRRADGVTVYGGPHVGSRGPLGSIKFGGAPNMLSEEDREWERLVVEAMVPIGESFGGRWREDAGLYDDGFEWDHDPQLAMVSNLWGAYRRPENDFFEPEGGSLFRRAG